MSAYAIILVSSFVFLTGSALVALRWALRNGQFEHAERAALLIFSEEEPVGQLSDRFPGRIGREEPSSPADHP